MRFCFLRKVLSNARNWDGRKQKYETKNMTIAILSTQDL